MFVHISSKKSPLISKGKNVVFFMIRKNTVYDKLVFFLVPLFINSFPRIDYFLGSSQLQITTTHFFFSFLQSMCFHVQCIFVTRKPRILILIIVDFANICLCVCVFLGVGVIIYREYQYISNIHVHCLCSARNFYKQYIKK